MSRRAPNALPRRLFGRVRSAFRDRLIRLFARIVGTDEGRRILHERLRGDFAPSTAGTALDWTLQSPYAAGARSGGDSVATTCARAPIFVTARFRSGSTLLWNVFRQVEGYTSYYEPFNERRWFDSAFRGTHTDQTHRGVDDYWNEYEGLSDLSEFYRAGWVHSQLSMEAWSDDPDMEAYIRRMITARPGVPVLQFNRADFRLPWRRSRFPSARILHVYRNPRDQWCSTLVDPARYPASAARDEFAENDEYYLENWVRDLSSVFACLRSPRIDHAYDHFYLLWRLSYIAGRTHSDVSVSFEALVNDPHAEVSRLFESLDVPTEAVEKAAELIVRPQFDRWRDYADEDWFLAREAKCEELIAAEAARYRVLSPHESSRA